VSWPRKDKLREACLPERCTTGRLKTYKDANCCRKLLDHCFHRAMVVEAGGNKFTLQQEGWYTMAHPTIQRGSTGQAVKDAQTALIARGYPVGPPGADGKFGNHTFRAVIDYQDDRSAGQFWDLTFPLKIDGIVGDQTWARLLPDPIKQGDKGAGVKLAQAILKNSGVAAWDPGPLDGDFGPNTKQAVKNFQTAMGITPANGEVDAQTWVALWS
jgi:peptidoglycan hydrolase-like protein with peptidoglycan-binding domain